MSTFSIQKFNQSPTCKTQKCFSTSSIDTQSYADEEILSSPSMHPNEIEERLTGPLSKKIKKQKVQKQEEAREPQRLSWKQAEDRQLLELYQQHGPKWCKLASLLGNRKPKQVRDRYLNVLRPGINQRPWTKEEDNLLIPLILKLGKRWCQIAEHMSGRTENQVKNRYYTHLSKGVLKDYHQGLQHRFNLVEENCVKNEKINLKEKFDNETFNFLTSLMDCEMSDLISDIPNSFGEDIQERRLEMRQNENFGFYEAFDFVAIPSPQESSKIDQAADRFFQSHSGEGMLQECATDPLDNMTYEEIIWTKSNSQRNSMDLSSSDTNQGANI